MDTMRLPVDVGTTWEALADSEQRTGAVERFDATTIVDLPEPARRFLARALPERSPLHQGVVIEMQGMIRLARRWFAFRADQILRAGRGFVWRAEVGARLIRFVGADLMAPGEARMEFKLYGRLPIVRASGPDVARSAVGRLAAETVAWLPQALTPQAGARWTAVDDAHAKVTLTIGGQPIPVVVEVAPDGRLESLSIERWNASSKPPASAPFGGRFGADFLTDERVRLGGTGEVGWGWGTPRWDRGRFFRFVITSAEPIGAHR